MSIDEPEGGWPTQPVPLADTLATLMGSVSRARAAHQRARQHFPGRFDPEPDPPSPAQVDYERWERIVGPSLASWRLDNLTHHLLEVAPSLQSWVDQPKWAPLILAGPSGTGKTAAACATAYAWRASKTRPVVLAKVLDLLDALRDNADEMSHTLLRRLRTVIDPKVPALVILDELPDLSGARYFARQTDGLGTIIDRICDARTRLIVTTNLNRAGRQAAWDQRLYSRIMGGAAVIGIQGGDLRGNDAPVLPGVGPCPLGCKAGFLELRELPDAHDLIEDQLRRYGRQPPNLATFEDDEHRDAAERGWSRAYDHFSEIVVRCPSCNPADTPLPRIRATIADALDRLDQLHTEVPPADVPTLDF